MTAQPITHLMPNDELDVWADIYAQAKIADLISIPLSEFLLAPWAHLSSAGQESAFDCLNSGHLPLLPQQVIASRAIHDKWAADDKAAVKATRGRLTLVATR